MPQFFGRLLSVLAVTMFITISLKAQSVTQIVREDIVDRESNVRLPEANVPVIESDSAIDHEMWGTRARALALDDIKPYGGLFNDPVGMVAGSAPDETTGDSRLNRNTFNVPIALNHTFKAQDYLRTGYLKSDGPTFQEDLFIRNTSLKSAAFRRAFIAPALLIAAGVCTLDEDNDDNYEVQAERNRHLPNFRYRADDYMQHAPIVVVYGLNWLGVEGKNDFANRTALLIKSEAIMAMLTFSLKRVTAVPRPDTKERTSLPSGHTAQAFAAATFMSREYGHKSIWYSIGAYTVATGVGAMRIMNNRHWASDVLVGAGIGILSTNLAYLTHQYRWGKKAKGRQTTILPSYDGQTGMVNIIHRIR